MFFGLQYFRQAQMKSRKKGAKKLTPKTNPPKII